LIVQGVPGPITRFNDVLLKIPLIHPELQWPEIKLHWEELIKGYLQRHEEGVQDKYATERLDNIALPATRALKIAEKRIVSHPDETIEALNLFDRVGFNEKYFHPSIDREIHRLGLRRRKKKLDLAKTMNTCLATLNNLQRMHAHRYRPGSILYSYQRRASELKQAIGGYLDWYNTFGDLILPPTKPSRSSEQSENEQSGNVQEPEDELQRHESDFEINFQKLKETVYVRKGKTSVIKKIKERKQELFDTDERMEPSTIIYTWQSKESKDPERKSSRGEERLIHRRLNSLPTGKYTRDIDEEKRRYLEEAIL
jgi:hypothetical protein